MTEKRKLPALASVLLLAAVVAIAGSGYSAAALSEKYAAVLHNPHAESSCEAVLAMGIPDHSSEEAETFLLSHSAAAVEDVSSVVETHLRKTCVKKAVRVPVKVKVCRWVREENANGAGSSLVKKCTYKIKWKTVYKTYCASVSHSH